MIDPKVLRNNLPEVVARLRLKGFEFDVDWYQKKEEERKWRQASMEQNLAERNEYAKKIGQAKARGEDVSIVMNEAVKINETIEKLQQHFNELDEELKNYLTGIPNVLDETVPLGKDETQNVEVAKWGTPREFDFKPKDHSDLGEALKLMDFEVAAKLSGARFVVLRRQLASLQRALIQLMLDTHTREHGYQEMYVPYLVKDEAFFGTGQLPKFADDFFKTREPFALNLIPTAEVSLTNTVREMILDEVALPIKLTAHTPCFRSEAGSYGKDTKGMIRQHQFEKVELVQIVHPQKSQEAHEELTHHAEIILQKLELPYRKMLLCSGDTGFCSSKTYDLEVWLPSQQTYREISSCSNMTDFQARRMMARFKDNKTGKNELVHTLNGSGLAVGRTLVAILENYQQQDGSITIPKALHKYLDFTVIQP